MTSTQTITTKAGAMAAQIANAQPLNHKEMTAHLRKRIAVAGIQARVRMQESCGCLVIQVFVPAYEINFTEDEQRTIRQIAVVNGLTWVQGVPIDVERMTDPKQFDFYFHGSKY